MSIFNGLKVKKGVLIKCNSDKEHIIIPKSVTSIGDNAFFLCTSLTDIDIPDSVTSIGYEAFASCKALTQVNIPDSVTYIGGRAFRNCTALTFVRIPYSVIKIDYSIFEDCKSLKTVVCPVHLKATIKKQVGPDTKVIVSDGETKLGEPDNADAGSKLGTPTEDGKLGG